MKQIHMYNASTHLKKKGFLGPQQQNELISVFLGKSKDFCGEYILLEM